MTATTWLVATGTWVTAVRPKQTSRSVWTANVSTVTTLPALAVVLLLPVLVPNLPGKAMGEQSLLLKYCLKEFNTLTRLVCFDCLFF